MTADKNFKRLVRERMKTTGETYATARAQLRPPRAGKPAHYSRPDETVIEALARATAERLPILAYVKHADVRRVTIDEALQLIRDRVQVAFFVMLDGKETAL